MKQATASVPAISHKKFASLALLASLSSLITYAGPALVTTLMYSRDADVLTVAYGNFTQARALALITCIGISIATLRGAILARKRNAGAVKNNTATMVIPAAITATTLTLVLMSATYTPTTAGDPSVHWALWLASIPAVVMTPAVAWVSAQLQAQNMDKTLLRVTAIRVAIITAATVGVVASQFSSTATALSVGILTSLGSAWTLASLWRACPDAAKVGVHPLWGTWPGAGGWATAWSDFGRSLLAITDILPVILMLTVLGGVSSLGDVRDAATVQVAMSFVRLTVVPIKQTGLVAGRLVLQSGAAASTLWKLFWLPATVGFIYVLFSILQQVVSPQGEVSLLFSLLLCGQILCDSVSLYFTSSYKVLRNPGFAKWVYIGIFMGVAIPALLLLGAWGKTSPEQLWSVMFVSRIALLGGVVTCMARSRHGSS